MFQEDIYLEVYVLSGMPGDTNGLAGGCQRSVWVEWVVCLLASTIHLTKCKKIPKASSTEGWATTLPDWKGARLVPGIAQEVEAEGL